MSHNESGLSASSSQPTLARIVANVVDLQQQLVNQIQNVTSALESIKIDHQNSFQALREDWRRTDDRSMKQCEELRTAHRKEIDNLLDIIKNLMESQKGRAEPVKPTPTPSQMAYAAAQSPASFFGGGGNDVQQRMQEQMIRQFMYQQQQQQLAAQGMIPNQFVGIPNQGVPPANSITTGVVNTPPRAPVPAVTVPKPTVGTVNLPVVDPRPSVVVPKAEPTPVKVEATPKPAPKEEVPSIFSKAEPVVPANNTTPKGPVISFGGVTSSTIFSPKTTGPAVSKAQPTENDDEETVDEYEPEVDFKPVVPLPDLVDLKTGEEDEKVEFEEKCKLFRWVTETKEFKERGVGMIKILKNPGSNKFRIVMRREQVHKVCANFPLSSGMSINKMARNEKAVIWFCDDFSENELAHEQFCAKFTSPAVADDFISKFRMAVEQGGSPVKPKELPAANKAKSVTPKPEEKKEETKSSEVDKITSGFGEQFSLKSGEWECTGCYTRQAADSTQCGCCGTNKDGSAGEKDVFAKSTIPTPKTNTKYSFGMAAAAAAAKDDAAPSTATTPKNIFGSSLQTQPAAQNKPTFSFGAPAAGGSIFGGNKSATPSTTSTATPTFSFGKPSVFGSTAASNASETASPATSSASPVSFSFKNSGKPLFGQKEAASPSVAPNTATSSASTTPSTTSGSKVFGSGFSSGISFSSLASQNKEGGIFSKENQEKAQAELAGFSKSKPFSTVRAEKNDDKAESGDEGDATEEYEPEVDFKPVVALPDLVEVKTGEEDENVLFTARAKLFRFDKELKENKERGLGEIKILKNRDTGKHRVVMRREHVHKLCANFSISDSIELKPKANQPNVYNWICKDFSENDEGVDEIFTIKFKTEVIAKDFVAEFTKAQGK